jgi:hypothetical protein
MDQIFDLIDSAAKRFPMSAVVARLEDKAESTLRNELNRQPGYKLGLATAVRIIRITRDFSALDCIEKMCGRVAFDIPPLASADRAPLLELAGQLAVEYGEYCVELGNALRDRKITADEKKRCIKEVDDVVQKCLQLKANLQAQKTDHEIE